MAAVISSRLFCTTNAASGKESYYFSTFIIDEIDKSMCTWESFGWTNRIFRTATDWHLSMQWLVHGRPSAAAFPRFWSIAARRSNRSWWLMWISWWCVHSLVSKHSCNIDGKCVPGWCPLLLCSKCVWYHNGAANSRDQSSKCCEKKNRGNVNWNISKTYRTGDCPWKKQMETHFNLILINIFLLLQNNQLVQRINYILCIFGNCRPISHIRFQSWVAVSGYLNFSTKYNNKNTNNANINM